MSTSFLPCFGGLETDTVDVEVLGKALGHADDHVIDQGTGQAVQGLVLLFVTRTGDNDFVVLNRDMMSGWTTWVRTTAPDFTVTTLPSILTSTPAGITIGILPILDMVDTSCS